MKPSGSDAASSKLRPVGLVRDRAALLDAGVLRVRAGASDPEDLVARTANSVTAEPTASTSPANSIPGIRLLGRRSPEKARLKNGFALRDAAVGAVDRRRVDSNQNLVVLGDGPLDLLEPQHLGRPVPVADDRAHHGVTTTLARACPSPM